MKISNTLRIAVNLAFLSLFLSHPAAAQPRYSPWSTPVHLGPPISSSFIDSGPSLSKDGLSLYFQSNRPCGEGDTVLDVNLWVSQRSSVESSWGVPECLEINLNGFEDSAPAFSRDGHWMYFVSDRPGSLGQPGFNARDIWISWRADVHDDHGWTQPVNGGETINSTFADAGPSYFENEELGLPQLFFTSNRNGTFDIWVSDVVGSQFGPPRRVDELSTDEHVEARPQIRHDGLEIFFFREVGVTNDIYSATRPDPAASWSEPFNIGAPINTVANEQQAFISSDRETLLFASDRPGTLGGTDIWQSVRSRVRGRP